MQVGKKAKDKTWNMFTNPQYDTYGCKPMHTNFLWPSGDKQQAMESIYEIIPDPILKNQTTE